MALLVAAGVSFADPCMDLYSALENRSTGFAGGHPPGLDSTRITFTRQSTPGAPTVRGIPASLRQQRTHLAALPLRFEPAADDAPYPYFLRGAGYHAFFAPAELVVSPLNRGEEASSETGAKVQPLRLRFEGGNGRADLRGVQPLPGKSHYFLGNDPKRWRTNVPTFARVGVDGLYPGVDLEYYERQGDLEVDLVVAPGADPDIIRLEIDGASAAALNADGDLVLQSGPGPFHLARPHIYQRVEGDERPVQGRYVLHHEPGVAAGSQPAGKTQRFRVGFELAQYDPALPLVIDPVLAYARRLGGSLLDQGTDIAADSAGNVYVTGRADSLDFPGVGGADPELLGTGGDGDAFIIKLGPDGTLLFSTFLGGDRIDSGVGIDIDDDLNIYVAGSTSWLESGFPTTPGAYRRTAADFFISKLDPTGSTLLYSTFLGYLNTGTIRGIATPSCGGNTCIAVTGTSVGGHPVTANAWAQSKQEADGTTFVSVLDPSQVGIGPQLIYSTYFAGLGGLDVADGPGGTVYILGDRPISNNAFPLKHAFDTEASGNREAFVSVFDPSRSGADSLIYSTFLGGSRTENGTAGHGAIAVDAAGVALVTGSTDSFDFPVTPEGQRVDRSGLSVDAFFVAIDPSRPGPASLRYGTYVGGSGGDAGTGVAAGAPGIAYVAGYTSSTDLPDGNGGTAPFFGAGNPGQVQDAFIAKFDWTRAGEASLLDAAYVGGDGSDVPYGVGADGFGSAAIAGYTSSTNGFDPSPGLGSQDVMVARLGTIIGLPDGSLGLASSDTLATNFGTPPYTWVLAANEPPMGLTLNADGTLSGTPTQIGSAVFTAEITDSLGASVQQAYRKTITAGTDYGSVRVRKSSGPAVPGRVVDYFILVRNVSDQVITNVELVEAVEPWFDFLSSDPAPVQVDQDSLPWTGADPPAASDMIADSFVTWSIPQMDPGELKVIKYRVRLSSTIDLGVTVNGKVCPKDKAKCYDDVYVPCKNEGNRLCQTVCDFEDNASPPGTDPFEIYWDLLGGLIGSPGCKQCLQAAEQDCENAYQNCLAFHNQEPCLPLSLPEGSDGTGLDCCDNDGQDTRVPFDPNEKSVGSPMYIPAGEVLSYNIHFENLGNIEAQDVFLTDVLDDDVGLPSVQVYSPFNGLVPLAPDTTVTLLADDDEEWRVSLDGTTRTLSWELLNINLPAGEGDSVFFAVATPSDLPSGTEIRNDSTIQFEVFEPLTTNETLNIVDDIPPVCSVGPLPATTTSTEFDVSWSGMDAVGEIDLYILYVSTDGGPFRQLALSDTPSSTAFTGEVGSTYGFLCISRDTARNVEAFEAVAETTTTVESAAPNVPPDADAGSDVTATLGDTVSLDGSGSQDPDSGPAPLSFGWRFVSVPATSALTDANIVGPDTAHPEFVPDVAGVYRLELTVSDGEASDSDEVEVTIETPPPSLCDVDGDGDIDRADLSLISRSRNQPASGPDDPRDANGDGIITPADVMACIRQCSRPSCATQ